MSKKIRFRRDSDSDSDSDNNQKHSSRNPLSSGYEFLNNAPQIVQGYQDPKALSSNKISLRRFDIDSDEDIAPPTGTQIPDSPARHVKQKSTLTHGDMLKPEDDPLLELFSQRGNQSANSNHAPRKKTKASLRASPDDDFMDDAVEVDMDSLKSCLKSGTLRSTPSSSAQLTTNKSRELTSLPSDSAYARGNFYVERPLLSNECKQRPFEPLILDNDQGFPVREVNPNASQYLMEHQIVAVQWLWSKFCSKKGAILGDDMGMGKTISVAALLLAYFEKTGTQDDVVRSRVRAREAKRGICDAPRTIKPCLIVCPMSITKNWNNELQKWGHFALDVVGTKDDDECIRRKLLSGETEILIMAYSKLKRIVDFLQNIDWAIVVFDEAHDYIKNKKTEMYKLALRLSKVDVRFGLTGTPIQNKLEEFWALMNVITGQTWINHEIYQEHFIDPIKASLSTKATEKEKSIGLAREQEHALKMKEVYLGRKKETLKGKNKLKEKEELLVLCDCADLQKKLYTHLLSLPDFDNCRHYREVCPCGISQERRAYCCHSFLVPTTRADPDLGIFASDNIDPRAVVWLNQHPNKEPCSRCPYCITLGCLDKLRKISMHPAMLQVKELGDSRMYSDQDMKMLQFTANAMSPMLLQELGGRFKSTNFLDIQRSLRNSGKMITLQSMLETFTDNGEKSLVFTHSTKMLDIIEVLVKSKGWVYCRLDGHTAPKVRQTLVDEFQHPNSAMKIFLISSKAGGVGLNLTAATKVIIYDAQWNPSTDQQSQDRAYRIGQHESVQVFRLVTKGTVEELIYMRQLYKQNIQQAILPLANNDDSVDKKEKDRFEGIQGRSDRQGELFGVANLLQFSETSILEKLRASLEVDGGAQLNVANTPADSTPSTFLYSKRRRTAAAAFNAIPESNLVGALAKDENKEFLNSILGDEEVCGKIDTKKSQSHASAINVLLSVQPSDEKLAPSTPAVEPSVANKSTNESSPKKRVIPSSITSRAASAAKLANL